MGRSYSWASSGRTNCKYCNAKFQYNWHDNSADRPRKAASQAIQKQTVTKAPVADDEVYGEKLRAKHSGDTEKMQAVELLFPKKQPTEQEVRKDLFSWAETSRSRHLHEARMLEQMRNSLGKRCAALVEYEEEVRLQEEKTEQAKQEAAHAKLELDRADVVVAKVAWPLSAATAWVDSS